MRVGTPVRQADCDQNDPEQFAVWALRDLPAPMRRHVSQTLWDCGFRHDPEKQVKRFEESPGAAGLGAHAPAKLVDVQQRYRESLNEIDPALLAEVDLANEAGGERRAKTRAEFRKRLGVLRDEVKGVVPPDVVPPEVAAVLDIVAQDDTGK